MGNTNATSSYVPPSWRPIEIWLFAFGQTMAYPCYFFIIYHLLATKAARKLLHNHAIVIMLFFNLIQMAIDLSMTMNYLRLQYVSPFTSATCLIQQFVDYGIWYGALFLILWTLIERHILIFHSVLVATARGRLLFHYIPLVFFSLYAPILYFYLIFLYPCENVYNAAKNLCGGVCYHRTMPVWYNWYESTVNYAIPILLVIVFSVGLLVRVIVQKRRLQQQAGWRRHRKMISQLVAISVVYLVFDLPYIIIMIVQWSGIPNFGNNVRSPYITNLTYVPGIVLPFAILVTLPDLKKKLRAVVICKKNRRAIGPMVVVN